jgi:type IV pilus assembly protein PilM
LQSVNGDKALAKYDGISSTEKLLDLIRDESIKGSDASGLPPQRPADSRLKNFISNAVSFKRSITVGVDLGHEDLKMVKINRISDQKYEMIDYARIPFDLDVPRQSPQFYQFLRPKLASFCGNSKNLEIWCTTSSARVETRQIRIPKVPAKQITNTVYWSYQKIAPFNEKEKIFDYEILGEVKEGNTTKTDVMSYTAPLQEIKDLKDLFNKTGYPLTGISIVPFAFQTMLRTNRIETDESTVSSLYIGRDWSRIDIFTDGSLKLSRGIKAGIRTMIEALRKEMERSFLELTLVKSPNRDAATIKAIKRKFRLRMEQAQQLFFGLIHDSTPFSTDENQAAIKEERVFRMILPALQRLVRQVERTLRHYSINFENARVGKIYVSSGVRPHRRIVDYISEELGLPTEAINPFADGTNFLSLVPNPESVTEKSSFAPAMGMALSSNANAPNFLHTYKDKKEEASRQRINRNIFGVFILLLALCTGISFWQDRTIRQKDVQKAQLQRKLESYTLRVDQKIILQLLDQTRANRKIVQDLGRRYLGLAVIGEITSLTPPNIRLVRMTTQLGSMGDNKNSKKILVLDGIIHGDRLTLESALAGYLIKLKNSPLFDQLNISRKSFEYIKEEQVLRFTAQLNLT